MSVHVERGSWEDRLLGRPGTRRHAITILTLLFGSAWGIYSATEKASRPRDEPARRLGNILTDIAVPDPIWMRARERENPFFSDFDAYRGFLREQGLERGVLITRVYSLEGTFLYHAFPPLDDFKSFQLISHIPAWSSGLGEGSLPHPAVHPLTTERLASRSAAEVAVARQVFPLTPTRLASDKSGAPQPNSDPGGSPNQQTRALALGDHRP